MIYSNVKELEKDFKLLKDKRKVLLLVECYRAYNSKEEQYGTRRKIKVQSYPIKGIETSKWFSLSESSALRHIESMKKGETYSTLPIPDTIGKFYLTLRQVTAITNNLIMVPQLNTNFCFKSNHKFDYELDLIRSYNH